MNDRGRAPPGKATCRRRRWIRPRLRGRRLQTHRRAHQRRRCRPHRPIRTRHRLLHREEGKPHRDSHRRSRRRCRAHNQDTRPDSARSRPCRHRRRFPPIPPRRHFRLRVRRLRGSTSSARARSTTAVLAGLGDRSTRSNRQQQQETHALPHDYAHRHSIMHATPAAGLDFPECARLDRRIRAGLSQFLRKLRGLRGRPVGIPRPAVLLSRRATIRRVVLELLPGAASDDSFASCSCRCRGSRADGCRLQWFGCRHAGRRRRNDGCRRNDGRRGNDGRRRNDGCRRTRRAPAARRRGRRGRDRRRGRRRHGGHCRARRFGRRRRAWRIRRRRTRWLGRCGRSGGLDVSELAAASRRSVQRARLFLRGLRRRRADRRLLHKQRLGRRPGSLRDGDVSRDRRRRHLPGGTNLRATRRRRGSADGVRSEWLRHRPDFLRLFAAVRGDVHRGPARRPPGSTLSATRARNWPALDLHRHPTRRTPAAISRR